MAATVFVVAATYPTRAQDSKGGPLLGLEAGPGRELVLANCMACHSTALIASNHMSREQWKTTIKKMRDVNGMWPLKPDVETAILDYLDENQRPKSVSLDKAKRSPWAAPLYAPNPIWEPGLGSHFSQER